MIRIVVIAASAGGLQPLRRIIAALPVPCTAAIFVALHIGPHPSLLPSLLAGRHPAAFARDLDLIEAGRIYVAPPDHHMLLAKSCVHLSRGPRMHHTRPAADPLFISAAKAYGRHVLGVVLSGGGNDGAEGARAITEHGGVTLVQSLEEADHPSMPLAALRADHPDACLPVEQIALRVKAFCSAH
jgi:two-component system chemotaxis response regulator CheB